MSAVHFSIYREIFLIIPLLNRQTRTVFFFSRLYNRLDGEYTEGETKKHRQKARCQELDKNVIINVRNRSFSNIHANAIPLFIKLFPPFFLPRVPFLFPPLIIPHR